MEDIKFQYYWHSPVGWLEITANDEQVISIYFKDNKIKINGDQVNTVIKNTIEQLKAYFNGTLEEFSLPLRPEGTDFQQKVWEQLQTIPYGQTISYGEVAEKLGDSNKVRAVGSANGQNPISIVIPCHRVIGANGALVGYGGGIDRKKWLLQHEGALLL